MPRSSTLDPSACHRALTARDARFDGVFFVGVATTGIYCRPVCPARTPRAERCSWFSLAAEAERAGFRACFRCRPELAPGAAPVDARPRLVSTALDAIGRGALAGRASVEDLAGELGVTSRHLRRTLEAELGVGPIEIETTRRLAIAKQLLTDTSLPLTRVADGAGFASVRRFNAAFRTRFSCAPSALRRAARPDSQGPDLRLRLDHRAPLDWDALAGFLAPRATPRVERVREGRFERAVRIDGTTGWLRIGPHAERAALVLELSASLARHAATLARAVRDLCDLDAHPDRVAAALEGDRTLGRLVSRRPGLRVPGALDPFEVAVRAVLAQQVSVAAATTLVGRVVERFGQDAPSGLPGLDRAFPTPARLGDAPLETIAAIGLPATRARALRSLARAVAGGEIVLSGAKPPRDVVRDLVSLPGIGPFTAEVIAMRALRDADAFPSGDLILARRLGARVAERAERWRPYRAYAAMHLWTDEGAKR